ncbi:MAG TPA: SulP family inorganic anion transporter [Pirellulaceae bacterium]|nr:SulP family inorganic anion transporter [Pirellulaceae bacterium]HMO92547.1 SulP family inorganic anion transporter [Pirellulaceae bacterium]HMP68971.1 SulP family inorganic anion transporter [Pirellulaceae bacterium]
MNIDSSVPRGNLVGFRTYFWQDLRAGLLVFLIALPLCMGIAFASGFPPLAGILTAVVGSIVATIISNSETTIKGPAAGLIVIAIGCINEFGGDGFQGGWTDVDMNAYRAALAVGFAAAILQVLFGIFRAGILGEFFPIAAVHGMLAAIGVIIITKQIPVALGVQAAGEPLEILLGLPELVLKANPAIALIGMVSISIMFAWPWITRLHVFLKQIPSPVIVLLATVPMGLAFDLLHPHSYFLQQHEYQLGEQYLVQMPDRVLGIFNEITTPNFSVLAELRAWKWVIMFFIIGTIESVLSTKAVNLLDPFKRKTNLDRDVIAVGVGNLCAASIGGLPMISEIVRSKANIDNGGKTRFSNFWHGMFLLVCVSLIPMVLHLIPLAALAGMLVYTGFRLAHPREFINVYRIGREQLAVFLITMIAVLATDLLIGIAIGIITKFAIHISYGVPLKTLFKPELKVIEVDGQTVKIMVGESAIFSNWIFLWRQIEVSGLFEGKHVILDMSGTKFVDHSAMEKLHAIERDFAEKNLSLQVIGLDRHQPLANHLLSARRRGLVKVKRVTIVTETNAEAFICSELVKLGASGYNAVPCHGVGKKNLHSPDHASDSCIRIEVIAVPEVAYEILEYLESHIANHFDLTASIDTVEVARNDAFKIENGTGVITEKESGVTIHSG